MDKKYTYFISSTYKDLIVERRAVANYVLKIDHIPIGMEQFGAIDTSQWQYITRLIDTSDYFILIVAGRYGAVDPTDPEGLSYTHKEFRYARQKGIPIIGVLHKNPGSISAEFSERDPKAAEKLAAFRDEIGNARLLAFYTDTPELITEVAASISKGMMLFQRPGWTRQDASSDVLRQQIEHLQRELAIRETEMVNLRNINAGLTDRFVDESRGLEKKRILDEANARLDVKIMFYVRFQQGDVDKEEKVETTYKDLFNKLGLLITNGQLRDKAQVGIELELFWQIFQNNKLIRQKYGPLKYSPTEIKMFIEEVINLKYITQSGHGLVLTDKGKLVYESLQ